MGMYSAWRGYKKCFFLTYLGVGCNKEYAELPLIVCFALNRKIADNFLNKNGSLKRYQEMF